MSTLLSVGSPEAELTLTDMKQHLNTALDQIGPCKKVLAIPPDYSRAHSQAGLLTEMVWRYYGSALTDVLPALGTHLRLTELEI